MSGQLKNKVKVPIVATVTSMSLVIVALVGVIVVLLNKKDPNSTGISDVQKLEMQDNELINRGFVDHENTDNVVNDMEEKVAKGMFECVMTTEWTFQNGAAASRDAYVANSDHNSSTICFDVYRRDNDELLYSSPLIPVGDELGGLKLDKELPAGE